MALADHEKRVLEEIEQRLFDEDPRFAAKLTRPSPLSFLSHRTVRLLGVLTAYLCGLLAVIAGVTWSSVALVGLGAVACAAVFTGLLVTAWRAHRR
ncbi:DUF3040 domain-containing protein [Nocardia sp. NRRL S-836]|uniref:DUF3040 domain-containing protein n=1 Tax=Nocardia sp. NRRL S-836 TaxID=1519492 RepID=UPI0006C08047|nr:DUF3040 domain-containing protein [Nocardia sp. NRRL S-836]KOV82452.1 hypothetical protein ADL03_24325 [Nocardia sp. NRRL S-836]